MTELWDSVVAWLTAERMVSGASALMVLAIGWVVARLCSAMTSRVATGRTSAQNVMILRRSVYYGLLLLAAASALRELGFDLSVLLGAAGVLTVAVGFASQTSASNLISGLFLLGEQPFVVGDTIRLGSFTGIVVSIDLLSVKLRTFDNLLVRVPNETLLKSEITNLTHYPIRRVDIRVRLPWELPMGEARELLLTVARAHPLCLDEPAPWVLFIEFAESSLVVELRAWAATPNYVELLNNLPDRIQAAIAEAGIAPPFPRRTITMASATEDPR